MRIKKISIKLYYKIKNINVVENISIPPVCKSINSSIYDKIDRIQIFSRENIVDFNRYQV